MLCLLLLLAAVLPSFHLFPQNIVVPDEHVVAKLLGRSGCDDCGKSYNVAAVHDDHNRVYMPPILPAAAASVADVRGSGTSDSDSVIDISQLRCDCGGRLSSRADDTAEVIEQRLVVYHSETAALVDYYRSEGVLAEYRVRYGTGDMEQLEQELRALLYSGADDDAAGHT